MLSLNTLNQELVKFNFKSATNVKRLLNLSYNDNSTRKELNLVLESLNKINIQEYLRDNNIISELEELKNNTFKLNDFAININILNSIVYEARKTIIVLQSLRDYINKSDEFNSLTKKTTTYIFRCNELISFVEKKFCAVTKKIKLAESRIEIVNNEVTKINISNKTIKHSKFDRFLEFIFNPKKNTDEKQS